MTYYVSSEIQTLPTHARGAQLCQTTEIQAYFTKVCILKMYNLERTITATLMDNGQV